MMQLTKQTFLDRWIYIVKEWIDIFKKEDALLKKGRSHGPTILSQRIGKGYKLLRLERHTPGAVCTWRFNCELLQEQSLVLTLDNLSDVERYLKRRARQRDPKNTEREIVTSQMRKASHRIAVSLINSVNRTEFIGVWDANFIDQWSTIHAEDYKAERIILYIVRMMMTYYEVLPDLFANEARVNKNWWEQRIKNICQGEFPETHEIDLTCRLAAKHVAE